MPTWQKNDSLDEIVIELTRIVAKTEKLQFDQLSKSFGSSPKDFIDSVKDLTMSEDSWTLHNFTDYATEFYSRIEETAVTLPDIKKRFLKGLRPIRFAERVSLDPDVDKAENDRSGIKTIMRKGNVVWANILETFEEAKALGMIKDAEKKSSEPVQKTKSEKPCHGKKKQEGKKEAEEKKPRKKTPYSILSADACSSGGACTSSFDSSCSSFLSSISSSFLIVLALCLLGGIYEAYATDKTVKKPAYWFKLIDAPLRVALLDVTGTKKVRTDEEAKKFKKDLFSLQGPHQEVVTGRHLGHFWVVTGEGLVSLDAPATSYDLHTELFTVVMEKSLSVTSFIKYVTNFKRIVSQAQDTKTTVAPEEKPRQDNPYRKRKRCPYCHKYGHGIRDCRKKKEADAKKGQVKSIRTIAETKVQDSCEVELTLKDNQLPKVMCLLDTGASVSCIMKAFLQQNKNIWDQRNQVPVPYVLADGTKRKSLGSITLNFKLRKPEGNLLEDMENFMIIDDQADTEDMVILGAR
ncbi:hypothetical protein ADUPG1_000252 [Aduncisulcus paluster]|uniref:Peptidase A2 domain-containing protein n=1 Tax=Aduncisulcus paluster TaxID=2918883 RepID=A0ABQ5K5L4_9EUKA|nr:hypothetical protein ADUPG1_000252 [Aduncisulcus paluster]